MHASLPRDARMRRRFLQLLAASPALGLVDLPGDWFGGDEGLARVLAAQQTAPAAAGTSLITAAADASSVFDLEAVAQAKLPPWHWAWMASGGDDGGTMRANREGFDRIQLKSRRLVDVSKVDTSVTLFGKTWETPIFLCPVGGHRMYNPDGELATARAAKSKKHLQVLSTVTTTSVEDVIAARGEPVWYQLYSQRDWNQTLQLVKRAEAAGCPAIAFTVDLLGGRNPEFFNRVYRANKDKCSACHVGDPPADTRNRPMLTGLKPSATPRPEVGTPTWEFVKRLKDATTMKVLVKGLGTREDAELAVQSGVDGVWVSNHGGRSENSLRSTIECLPDVVAGVRGRVPVVMDSGVRRGTDVFKALALGATAVGIGRAYIWGLASFGQEGVEVALEILRRELQLTMRQTGVTSLKQIGAAQVRMRT
jgi:isopentenyl diphosphate isomerase/L-lactate dehydrogenase-like FMN-dependent dehydrogenase